MTPKFLIPVLWATTVAVPAAARPKLSEKIPGSAVVVKRETQHVFKNGGDGDVIDCVELLPDGSFRVKALGEGFPPCRIGFSSGVQIRVDEGEIITTETEGNSVHGMIRVYTSGLPYRLFGDQVHLIEPNAIADVIVENNLTYIFSKEGDTSVVACEASHEVTCVQREFHLLEGDMLILTKTGHINDWEDSEGNSLSPESGGCSTGGGAPSNLWVLVLWTLMWFRRRKRQLS